MYGFEDLTNSSIDMDQQNGSNGSTLSCVKDVSILPASFSLHSVDFLPTEDKNDPKFCCMTLRNTSNGHLYSSDHRSESEIKVVHGNSEVHNCIKSVLSGGKNDESGESPIQLAQPDGIWSMPFRIPLKETKTTVQVNRQGPKKYFVQHWNFAGPIFQAK